MASSSFISASTLRSGNRALMARAISRAFLICSFVYMICYNACVVPMVLWRKPLIVGRQPYLAWGLDTPGGEDSPTLWPARRSAPWRSAS